MTTLPALFKRRTMKYWTDDQFQDELYSAIAHGLSDTDATKEDIVIAVENVVKVIREWNERT